MPRFTVKKLVTKSYRTDGATGTGGFAALQIELSHFLMLQLEQMTLAV